ncbi:MAG: aminotransferase class I/II-fold pyridoxal phosphate-dependent enzyme [Eubacterium sp.]|nr:aminotransferase class I/II-fold pyridoxal phosphate-dependent enzyme [Eubacterium sp.]
MSHGGDIYRNNIEIDLSVNVNPMGCPTHVYEAMSRALSDVEKYPDIRHEKLIGRLSDVTGVHAAGILIGNGASELIMAVMRFFEKRRVLVPVPSFSGYRYAADAAGCEMVEYLLSPEDDFDMTGFPEFIRENAASGDVILFANPNNPNGRIIEKELLDEIIEAAGEKDAYVVVDECFLMLTGRYEELSGVRYIRNTIDKSPKNDKQKSTGIVSGNDTVAYNKIIVIDAFTKTFAVPGVRLGMFYAGDNEVVDGIRRLLPEWNISCIAEAAGLAALSILEEYMKNKSDAETYICAFDSRVGMCDDEIVIDYFKNSISFIKKERSRLVNEINDVSGKRADQKTDTKTDDNANNPVIRIFSSDANYLLLKTDIDLYKEMLERGILIRGCSDYRELGRGYYRIAVSTEENNDRFCEELRELINRTIFETKE